MALQIVTRAREMRAISDGLRREGRTVGFVPTMGFLHEGHLSLVRASRARCDSTVVSIFVNPTQFGPKEDFGKYPRDLDRDRAMLEAESCDHLFLPEVREMYSEGARTFVEVERLQDHLCGRSRPGHFRGVATIVTKLFNAVNPDAAFFGQKDAQQAALLRRMTADLLFPIELVVCPTTREADGLAMSSRNSYLTPAERAQAPALYRSLLRAREMAGRGDRSSAALAAVIRAEIEAAGLPRIDYIEIVDADSFQPVTEVNGRAVAAVAVQVGRARLIDNIELKTDPR